MRLRPGVVARLFRRSVAGHVGLLQFCNRLRLDWRRRRGLRRAGVSRPGRQIPLGRRHRLWPGIGRLRLRDRRRFGGAGVSGAGGQVALGLGDRLRPDIGDLDCRHLRLHLRAAASAAARVAGRRHRRRRFLAAGLFGVVGAAAEQPGEEPANSTAARHLHISAARFDLGSRLFIARHGLPVGRDEYGLPIGEQTGQRVSAHLRPISDRPAVDMHPRGVAGRVEAHAAGLRAHGDVANARRADVEKMRVDRLALHMLRMLGHLSRPPAQHRVGLRRTIAGQDVDRLGRPGLAIDLPDDVEEVRVHLGRLVEPPIPAEPVQFIEHRLVIDAVDHEGERAGFIGVLVREDHGPRVAVGDRRLGRVRNKPGERKRRRHRHVRCRSAAAHALAQVKTRQ